MCVCVEKIRRKKKKKDKEGRGQGRHQEYVTGAVSVPSWCKVVWLELQKGSCFHSSPIREELFGWGQLVHTAGRGMKACGSQQMDLQPSLWSD